MEDGQGRLLHTYTWAPVGEVVGLVFLCHGYGELTTPYYTALAEEAAARGLLAFAHDHVGHGRSGGERVQAAAMEEYTAPVLAHCRAVAAAHPALPLYIMGHSMGGTIALLAVLTKEVTFAGMVLVGPLIQLDPKVAGRAMKLMARVASRVAPGLQLVRVDTRLVTRDLAWRDTIDSNPLHYHGGAKARQGHVLMKALERLAKQFGAVTLPYLILHGSEDRVCRPEGSRALHAASSSKDSALEVVEGAAHSLYLEPEPVGSRARGATLDWILARII